MLKLLIRTPGSTKGSCHLAVYEEDGEAESWAVELLIETLQIHVRALKRRNLLGRQKTIAERAGMAFAASPEE